METDAERMAPELLRVLEGKKRELDRHRPFPPEIVRNLEEQFRLEWTYNSNAIEGNTLSLRETELVLNRGLTIGKKSLREQAHELSPPELAAWIHCKLVRIHPFTDGNGRTARLLMNLVLMRTGYPPAVILTVDRKRYYRVLKEADSDRHSGFLAFIGRSVDRSLSIYLNALKSAAEPSERHGYIPLSEATRYCNYGIEYLSYLARTGRLGAVKIGSRWMTTREALEEYAGRIAKTG
jgi:Fic family protein